MRVELTADEASLLRTILAGNVSVWDEDVRPDADRLAHRFTPPERLTAILHDGSPVCPRCGGEEFGYVEGTAQYWPHGMTEEETETVWLDTIGWDGVDEVGDGQPGLFCDHYRGGGCGAPIDLPEGWGVDYR